jgi:hypothetical protein
LARSADLAAQAAGGLGWLTTRLRAFGLAVGVPVVLAGLVGAACWYADDATASAVVTGAMAVGALLCWLWPAHLTGQVSDVLDTLSVHLRTLPMHAEALTHQAREVLSRLAAPEVAGPPPSSGARRPRRNGQIRRLRHLRRIPLGALYDLSQGYGLRDAASLTSAPAHAALALAAAAVLTALTLLSSLAALLNLLIS